MVSILLLVNQIFIVHPPGDGILKTNTIIAISSSWLSTSLHDHLYLHGANNSELGRKKHQRIADKIIIHYTKIKRELRSGSASGPRICCLCPPTQDGRFFLNDNDKIRKQNVLHILKVASRGKFLTRGRSFRETHR